MNKKTMSSPKINARVRREEAGRRRFNGDCPLPKTMLVSHQHQGEKKSQNHKFTHSLRYAVHLLQLVPCTSCTWPDRMRHSRGGRSCLRLLRPWSVVGGCRDVECDDDRCSAQTHNLPRKNKKGKNKKVCNGCLFIRVVLDAPERNFFRF